MNYIFDILVNFNDEMYDFFDWNDSDKILHIRKIPIFKISKDNLKSIKEYKFNLEESFFNKIYNKTEMFGKNKVINLKYACIFSDGIDAIAINIDKDLKYSSFLLDEFDEIVEVASKLELTNINIKKIDKNEIKYVTRKDVKIINYLDKEITKILKNKEDDRLKYLYYECFNEKKEDINYIIKKFRNIFNETNNKMYLKLYEIFKVTVPRK